MPDEMTDEQKKEFVERFERRGASLVQTALDSPAYSNVFGTPNEVKGAREVASQWLDDRSKKERRRRRRNDSLLFIGVVVAVFGLIALFI